ncbi:unnamed protein product, partial [Urochloa humidicola]
PFSATSSGHNPSPKSPHPTSASTSGHARRPAMAFRQAGDPAAAGLGPAAASPDPAEQVDGKAARCGGDGAWRLRA